MMVEKKPGAQTSIYSSFVFKLRQLNAWAPS